jgi:hypothetical protein
MNQYHLSGAIKRVAYLTKEILKLADEGFLSQEEAKDAIDGLADMTSAELLEMYQAWKD